MAIDTIGSEFFQDISRPMSSLRYPEDLGVGRLGHYINFYIHTQQKSSFSQSSTSFSYSTPEGKLSTKTVFDSATKSSIQTIATQSIKSIYDIGTLSSSNPFINGLESAAQGIVDFIVTGGKTKITDVISLYMPDTVSMNQLAVYNNESLTNALGALGAGASAIKTAADAASSTSLDMESLKNAAMNPQMAEAAFGQSNKNLFGTTNSLQNIALSRIGYALNPQMQVIFKDINFRVFQYDFMFAPRSASEAATVTKIIKLFKLHAAPEIDTTTLGRYFIVPSMFDIEYMMEGKRNENIHKISTCVLTSVVVDYAPEGWVTYENGMPIKTRLTLQFQETELMSKQRISDGF